MTYVAQSDPIETHRVTDRRPSVCEHHGAFEQVRWQLASKPEPRHNWPTKFLDPFWSRCPKCDEDIRREQDDLAAKARGTSTDAVRMRRLLGECGVPARFHSATLANFNTSLPKQKTAHQWASNYAYKFDRVLASGQSCALIGTPGTGKTHIACAILRHVISKGSTGRYTTCADLLNRFKASFAERATESESQVWASLTGCDLLVVDEIGRQQDTAYDQAQMFRVLDNRYHNCRPTILVSNLPSAQFAEMMGSALLDRLSEGGGGKVLFEFASQRHADHPRGDE